MSSELIAELADLFVIEGLEADEQGDTKESDRLFDIAEKLFERAEEVA